MADRSKGNNGKSRRDSPESEIAQPVVSSAIRPEYTKTVKIGNKEVTVEFVAHAVEQMENRGISSDEVLVCIRIPDKRNLPANLGRKRYWRCRADSTATGLNVVFELLSPTRIRVVTAYYGPPP